MIPVLFFAFLKISFAEDNASSASQTKVPDEPAKVVALEIKKAESLTLKQKRKEAIKILTNLMSASWLSDSSAKIYRQKVEQSLNLISEMFLTESAQKDFELGRTLVGQDLASAQNSLNQALVQEPFNLSILSLMGQVFLLQNKCKEAKNTFDKAEELNPYSLDLVALKSEALMCLGGFDEFIKWKVQREVTEDLIEKEPVLLPFQLSSILAQQKEIGPSQTAQFIQGLIEKYPKQPMLLYWKWKLETQKDLQTEVAKEYLDQCGGESVKRPKEKVGFTRSCIYVEEVKKGILEYEELDSDS